MFCPNCGAENPESATYCASCNQALVRSGAGLKAVEGWLAFFIFTLVVACPAWTLWNLWRTYLVLQGVRATNPHLFSQVVPFSFLSLLLMGFSVYAGVLLQKKTSSAVKIAKAYLVTRLAYSLGLLAMQMLMGTWMHTNFNATIYLFKVITPLAGYSIYSAVWYAYLNTSERVRATYPHLNLSS